MSSLKFGRFNSSRSPAPLKAFSDINKAIRIKSQRKPCHVRIRKARMQSSGLCPGQGRTLQAFCLVTYAVALSDVFLHEASCNLNSLQLHAALHEGHEPHWNRMNRNRTNRNRKNRKEITEPKHANLKHIKNRPNRIE